MSFLKFRTGFIYLISFSNGKDGRAFFFLPVDFSNEKNTFNGKRPARAFYLSKISFKSSAPISLHISMPAFLTFLSSSSNFFKSSFMK